jgi:glycosyltransferase involved in cell wall biosynthesis
LLAGLLILRARRIGIVWSVHNLMPHEPVRPRVQRFIAVATYLLADRVIVHSEYARARVQHTLGRFRRRPVHVIPHANYVGAYPAATQSREATRDQLGVPHDSYVYLCFGQVRGYKRLGALAERFATLPAQDARLLIVGRAVDDDEATRLQAHAAADPRIVLRLGHVPDQLVASLHQASDAAVIAYADVFSSGALLLALSYGVPVVAPGAGTASELFGPPAVEFFSGIDVDLLDALERVRRHREPRQADAALRAALAFPWSSAGTLTAEVYRLACRRRRGTPSAL